MLVFVYFLNIIHPHTYVKVNPVYGIPYILKYRLKRHEQATAFNAGFLPSVFHGICEKIYEAG